MKHNEGAKRDFEAKEVEEVEESDLKKEDQASEEVEYSHNGKMTDLSILYDERNKLEEKLGEPSEPEPEAAEEKVEEGKKEEIDNSSVFEKARKKFDKMFAPAEKKTEESKEVVDEIRRRLGVKTKGGEVMKVNEHLRQQLSAEQRSVESEIGKLEKEALDFPDAEALAKNGKEFKPDFSDILKEAGEIEKEMKEAREKFVERFIEKSVEAVLKHFHEDFKESKNGSVAEDIVELKTEKEIWRGARGFIEGGEADFGFMATLEISSFEVEGGEKKQYITGYTVDILGHEEKLREDKTVLPSGREELLNQKIIGSGVEKEIKE